MIKIDIDAYKIAAIDKIDLNIESNTLSIQFYWPNLKGEVLKLEGILSLHYQPDFTDEPPWICLDFSIEEINNIDELKQSEVLWKKGSPALKELNFPIYRVMSYSGDYNLVVVCQKLKLCDVT
jgi:hypothetical protein